MWPSLENTKNNPIMTSSTSRYYGVYLTENTISEAHNAIDTVIDPYSVFSIALGAGGVPADHRLRSAYPNKPTRIVPRRWGLRFAARLIDGDLHSRGQRLSYKLCHHSLD